MLSGLRPIIPEHPAIHQAALEFLRQAGLMALWLLSQDSRPDSQGLASGECFWPAVLLSLSFHTTLGLLSGQHPLPEVYLSNDCRRFSQGISYVAIISGYKSYKDAISALKANEIDAFADHDTLLLSYILKDNSLKLLPQKYTQEAYAIAFRKGTESTRTIEIVNNVLTVMKKNGTLNRMKAQWQIK